MKATEIISAGVFFRKAGVTAGLLCAVLSGRAEYKINYSAEILGNVGDGTFAPSYIAANRHGVLTQTNTILFRGGLFRPWQTDSRFSYGWGIDLIGDYANATAYRRYFYNSTSGKGSWDDNHQRPQGFWIQQLYGEVRYRGVFLTAGLKERKPALLNYRLSSGDLVESGNSRPVPEVRVGFTDFQNIPFTNGWVQIQGEISYGKLTDNGWLKNHFNYYTGHLNLGALYSYKRCYFRTNPMKPFSATVGMQVGAMFGGTTSWYSQGKFTDSRTFSRGIKEFFRMLVPKDGGDSYYSGSSLGSWDVHLRYWLRNGGTVSAYMQKPWEDGSGIGFLNGFDGLWGLEYKAAFPGVVSGVVLEYIDFTNQSGPMHWDPDDAGGSSISTRGEGADDYYNNHEYNSWAYYGMSIGTPFLPAPIYNRDGYLGFVNNRVRGFHVGVEGEPVRGLRYRLLGGYKKGWGSGYIPSVESTHNTSLMAEVGYTSDRVEGLSISAQVGFDTGTMLGDHVGGSIGIRYCGDFTLGKKKQ